MTSIAESATHPLLNAEHHRWPYGVLLQTQVSYTSWSGASTPSRHDRPVDIAIVCRDDDTADYLHKNADARALLAHDVSAYLSAVLGAYTQHSYKADARIEFGAERALADLTTDAEDVVHFRACIVSDRLVLETRWRALSPAAHAAKLRALLEGESHATPVPDVAAAAAVTASESEDDAPVKKRRDAKRRKAVIDE
jgi:hypothetical protein